MTNAVQNPIAVNYNFDHARKLPIAKTFIGYVAKEETFAGTGVKNSTVIYARNHQLTVPIPESVFDVIVWLLAVTLILAAVVGIRSCFERKPQRS